MAMAPGSVRRTVRNIPRPTLAHVLLALSILSNVGVALLLWRVKAWLQIVAAILDGTRL